MKIKVKKLHPDAELPVTAIGADAGFDLVAIDDGKIKDTYIQYKTGIAVEPPPGYHTEIFPRSSVSKMDLVLANSIGLVDGAYRGELLVRFKIIPEVIEYEDVAPSGVDAHLNGKHTAKYFDLKKFKKGDRIAQLVLRKTEKAEYEWAEELSDTQRGDGGFGSTGG